MEEGFLLQLEVLFCSLARTCGDHEGAGYALASVKIEPLLVRPTNTRIHIFPHWDKEQFVESRAVAMLLRGLKCKLQLFDKERYFVAASLISPARQVKGEIHCSMEHSWRLSCWCNRFLKAAAIFRSPVDIGSRPFACEALDNNMWKFCITFTLPGWCKLAYI